MDESLDNDKLERVTRILDPANKLIRAWNLKGGFTSQVIGLEIEQPDGSTKRVVLRRHGDLHLRQDPNVASKEFRLLGMLQSVGLDAPAPCCIDETGEIFPKPYIVVEYLEGDMDLEPSDPSDCILQLAMRLSRIHGVGVSSLDLSFLSSQDDWYSGKLQTRPARVDESLSEGRIRDVLKLAWPLPHTGQSVLLHGDYWPGNVLWRDGRLVGVIDWEAAATGNPLGDLAYSRLEILWAFGIDAMHEFTRRYVSITAADISNLAYWDLCAALRHVYEFRDWALDDEAERQWRQIHALFVAQAFDEVA